MMEMQTPMLGSSPRMDENSSEDEEVIEERVRKTCQKWELDDHTKILEEILKPYKEIVQSYLRFFDECESMQRNPERRLFADGAQFVNAEQLTIVNKLKEKMKPKIDIELEYFVPGLDKIMLDLIYWKFIQLWDVKINYAFKAVTIKIRNSFEAEENDPHVYFDNLGEFGGYIRLFWRENHINKISDEGREGDAEKGDLRKSSSKTCLNTMDSPAALNS